MRRWAHLTKRVAVSATVAGLLLPFGDLVVGHATSTWTCAAPFTMDVPNDTSPTVFSGTLSTFSGGVCATTDESALPFISGATAPSPTGSVGYTYQGNCAEGVLAFATGAVGIFSDATLTIIAEANGEVGTSHIVLKPSLVPCTGGVNWWSGEGIEAGG